MVPFVEQLIKYLNPKGIQVFFDRDSRPLNDPAALNTGLASGLSAARVFLPCTSSNYLSSSWCSKELSAFFWKFLGEKQAVEAKNQPSELRLAVSPPLYCVPVILGCNDPDQAVIEVSRLEMSLLTVAREPNALYRAVSDFIRSSKKVIYRAGNGPDVLAGQAGDLIEELLANHSEEKRDLSIKELWRIMWRLYQDPETGASIDPDDLFMGFLVGTDVLKTKKSDIESYADEGLIELFVCIAEGKSNCVAFDRWNAVSSSSEPVGDLRASSMIGDPIVLLVSQLRNHPMVQEFQYSYYAFLSKYGKNKLVDVCAATCLAMNIHSWHEGVRSNEDFREIVLTPLSEGKDIVRHISY